ncbi:hypothetical protein OH799_22555 [Nocardia sp. NBC_00881]|uniref:hypothetical protein n=1 Tax=Nocardia sp. NBC_00881 TaxID=2975995 RepID=UPI00386F12AC|nr:hypothetical protein OH799_22555 [Nocardia sp. NBC_00881]
MVRIFIGVCSVAAGMALTLGCSSGQQAPIPGSPSATSRVSATPRSETPQERNVRIRQKLIELGCSSNACIQTYFGCADGYITGEACDFYREHPIY